MTVEVVPRGVWRRRRTVTGTPVSTAPPKAPASRSVRELNQGSVSLAGGGPVAASAVTASAVASVFMPSAASRPSRLAAVARTSECSSLDFTDGAPDRIAFPLQATFGGSAWVGSIVVNAALTLLIAIAVLVVHRIGGLPPEQRSQ
jgi:hypothetical protein